MRIPKEFASIPAYKETREKLVKIAKEKGDFQCEALRVIIDRAYSKIFPNTKKK